MKKSFINPARANKPDVKGEARAGTGRGLANKPDVKGEARPSPHPSATLPLLPVANKPDVKGEAAGPGDVKPGCADAAGPGDVKPWGNRRPARGVHWVAVPHSAEVALLQLLHACRRVR